MGVKRVASPEEKMQTMGAFSGLNAIMALTAAVVLYAFHLGHEGVHWSVYMAAALCCAIAVHQTISFAFNRQLQRRLAARRAHDATRETAPLKLPDAAPQNTLPPAAPSPFFSVTEATTNKLREPVPRARPRV